MLTITMAAEIKEQCINTLISFGLPYDIAKAVVSELSYESVKRNPQSTYKTVFEFLGKFTNKEIEEIRSMFQSVNEDMSDTDAILFVIDVYKRYC